jgi:rod shape-determining protein MreD
MTPGGARPLDPASWIGLPMLWAIGATILFAVPLRVFGLQLPEPAFALALVFAWAVIRPSVLAPFAVLALGLFLDVFWGSPMGLWALSMLVAYGATLSARSFMVGQSGAVLWGWYGAMCALTLAAGSMFTLMQTDAAPSFGALGWQWFWTVLLYPLVHRLIDRFEDADVRFR